MDNNENISETSTKPKVAKSMLALIQPLMNENSLSEDKRLRSQHYLKDREASADSDSNSSSEDEEYTEVRPIKTKQTFLNRKTVHVPFQEHSLDLLNQELKPSTDDQSKISQRSKLTKRRRCPKQKAFKKKEKKDSASFDPLIEINDDYSQNHMNIFYDDNTRKEILITIASATKHIADYEKEFFGKEERDNKDGKEKDNDKGKKGYPEKCIPINADVSTFNFNRFIQKHSALSGGKKFDIVLLDPPWQLSSSQPTRGVAITYSTLSDEDISALNIDVLQTDGFIFIWTINAKFQFVFELLDKWGYVYCDVIHWIKKTKNGKYAKGHGFYLQHSKESCIVGIKGHPIYHKDIRNCDIIFSQRRGQSQKPNELYEKIEMLCPNGYYLELFGRRNNLRDNWVTIGNEI